MVMKLNHREIFCHHCKDYLDSIHLVDCLGGAVTSVGPSVAGLQVAIFDLTKIYFKIFNTNILC